MTTKMVEVQVCDICGQEAIATIPDVDVCETHDVLIEGNQNGDSSGFACPTCGRVFTTERGLHRHETVAHG